MARRPTYQDEPVEEHVAEEVAQEEVAEVAEEQGDAGSNEQPSNFPFTPAEPSNDNATE